VKIDFAQQMGVANERAGGFGQVVGKVAPANGARKIEKKR
jgi:hypothetical protein